MTPAKRRTAIRQAVVDITRAASMRLRSVTDATREPPSDALLLELGRLAGKDLVARVNALLPLSADDVGVLVELLVLGMLGAAESAAAMAAAKTADRFAMHERIRAAIARDAARN